MATKASGSLSSAVPGNAASVDMGWAGMAVYGTFTATLTAEISLDGGTTWITLKLANGSSLAVTAQGETPVYVPVDGAKLRWNCSPYTSGTINYRIDQQ
jgi:hypothetical protein